MALLRGSALVFIVATFALGACTTVPNFPNKPLPEGASNAAPAAPVNDAPDSPVILVAFSGGGSRAAALGLGVLDELAATTYPVGDQHEVLVDRIWAVSSVSGGSVIAAWFGLVGPAHLDDLKTKFLTRNNMASLEWQAADPVTWTRLAFSGYTRIDALRDLLDREVLHGAQFSAFRRPGAPFVVMNATDMESGEVFAFTPQRFNDLCSDLDQLPISVGVAASAAFPVALSPMSLRNYNYEICKGHLPPASTFDLTNKYSRYVNLEAYKRARYENALRNGPAPYRNEHYIHLLDGGLADNQGIHSLIDILFAPHSPLPILFRINTGQLKRIAVISVNARSDTDNGIGARAAEPGMLEVVNTVIGTPIDSTTAYANASLQELVGELQSASEAASAAPGNAKFAGLQIYSIPIDFDQFLPSQRQLQTDVKSIGTSWTLSPKQLQEAMDAGKMLLLQHPCYQRLLLELKSASAYMDPATAREGCPLQTDKPS